MTFEKPRVTFDLKTPMEDHYHATISNMTSLECIHWIRQKLTPKQQQMFRSTCFGHFLDMRELTFPSQLVHNILLREVETVGLTDEMWFLVSGKVIRFSAYEFGLVTGLKFDKVPTLELPSEKNRLRDTYFDGLTLQLKDFRERILQMDLSGIPDLDVVKLALYFVLERLLMGRDRRRYINLQWLRMVDYLDIFDAYPWGVESYEMTITSMSDALRGRTDRFKQRQTVKKGTHAGERYNLTGCPYAVQAWLYEAIPFVATAYGESGKQFSDKIPRMLKWMTTRVPTEVEVRRDVFVARKDRPIVILDPTPAERATPWYLSLERHMGVRRGPHVQWALRESLPLAANEIDKAQGVAATQEVPLVDSKLKASKPRGQKKEPLYSTVNSTTQQGDPEMQQGDDETQLNGDVQLPDSTLAKQTPIADDILQTILGQMASHFTHVTQLLESQSKEMKGMFVEINALRAEVRDLKARFDEVADMDTECFQPNPEAHDPHLKSYPSTFQESQGGNSPNNSLELENSYSKGRKRMKISSNTENYSCMSSSRNIKNERKRQKTKVSWSIIDYSDPFGISDLQNLDFDRFGSVAKDIKDLMDLKVRTWGPLLTNNPLLLKMFVESEKKFSKQDSELANQEACHYAADLGYNCEAVDVPFLLLPNDEDEGNKRPSYSVHEVLMQSPAGQFITEDTMVGSLAERTIQTDEKDCLTSEPEIVIQIGGKERLACEADKTVQMEGKECLASEAERTVQMEGNECLASEAERTLQMEKEESLALKQKEDFKSKEGKV